MKETEKKSLDPQLWQACAKHSQSPVNFPQRIHSLVLCRVATVKFLADPDTDEVSAKIGFVPSPTPTLISLPIGNSVVNDDSGPLPIPIALLARRIPTLKIYLN
ncbi:hypothetical protein NC651_010389 [Populus alba x Populus x berolinensis]|nr:hypothetical protein NC651_010389 [Populus alba x Populus x berolinensis]